MATVKPRGKSWQLQWSDATGHHRKSLGKISKTEADLARREKELELKTGRRYRSTGTTLAAFAVDYLEWYEVQFPQTYSRTEIIVNRHLVPELGTRDLDTIVPLDVTRFIGKRLDEGAAPSTTTREVRCLLAMLNRAKEWRMVSEHGLESYSAPAEVQSKPPLYFERLQLQRLYWASYAYENVWRLIANTGLRRNEALFLKHSDIKRDEVLHIESLEGTTTKSKKWREVPLNDAALGAIQGLRSIAPKTYLLARVKPTSLTRAFDACANRVALPGSLHTLRHTFISHLVMAGVDLRTVQSLAGHASITTTMKYAHLAPGHRQQSVLKIAL